MNTVLLTGASGFLGKIILEKLSLLGNNILTIGRSPSNNIYCDLTKSSLKFIPNNIDLVIHAAGKAHFTPNTREQEIDFFNVNVVGTKNLLECLAKSGIPKYFVYISSVSVYGKDFGIEINENEHLGALDPYGNSKIEAEKIVLDWCNEHNVVCTILRLPLVVGPNPPGNLGAMIKGIRNGYYLNIAGGRAKKSMVLGEDVAKYIPEISEIGGIYNLTDGYHPSFEEFSNHISNQLGKGKPANIPLWLAKIVAKFGDLLGCITPFNTNKLNKITKNLTFDDNKARAAFGWDPKPILKGFKIN